MDNVADVQIADSIEEQKVFDVAYAKGILNILEISIKENPTQSKPSSSEKYYVQVGCLCTKRKRCKTATESKRHWILRHFIKEF